MVHVSELWKGQRDWNQKVRTAMAQKEGLSWHLQGSELADGTAGLSMQLGDRRREGSRGPDSWKHRTALEVGESFVSDLGPGQQSGTMSHLQVFYLSFFFWCLCFYLLLSQLNNFSIFFNPSIGHLTLPLNIF